MKKVFYPVVVILLVMMTFSCGGGTPKVETSPEMADFIGMFKGSYSDVTAALNKYAATEELKKDEMSVYDLKEPKIIATEGSCYTFEAKAGLTSRTYKICWTDKKISGIEFLGMK